MSACVIGRVARLKPEGAAEYARLHAEEWGTVRGLYHDAGFRRFRILHHPSTGLLVSVVEHGGPDPNSAFQALWRLPAIDTWRRRCAAHQEAVQPAAGAGIWAPADLILSDDLDS